MRLFILASASLDRFQQNVLAPVFESDRIEVVGVCIDDRKGVPRLKKLRREWKRGRGGYVLLLTANDLLARLRLEPTPPSRPYFDERGVPVYMARRLYGEETLAFIKERRPDCIFRTGFGIIREPLLSLAPKGMISYHHGDIRKYRGTPVAFWELFHGQTEMGATVQVLAPGLDCGKIVKEIRLAIHPWDTWGSLTRRAYAESERMIYESCLLLDRKGFEPDEVPESGLGRVFTRPDLRHWLGLHAKVLWRRLRWALLGR